MDMVHATIILDAEGADRYLAEHSIAPDAPEASIEAMLLQPLGTEHGLPCVRFVAEVDGQKRVVKTTLRLLIAATRAMNTATERQLGPDWRGP
jgi:hypothetical protein